MPGDELLGCWMIDGDAVFSGCVYPAHLLPESGPMVGAVCPMTFKEQLHVDHLVEDGVHQIFIWHAWIK